MPSVVGRKFLMAGRGGLNLTHSEALPEFLARYREAAAPRLEPAIDSLSARALCAPGARRWGRRPSSVPAAGCFRKAFKASPLLRAWLRRLDSSGVHSRCAIAGPAGMNEGHLSFQTPDGARAFEARATCSRSAARVGRGSAPMAHGRKRSPHEAWRYRRSGPPIAGFTVAWSEHLPRSLRGPTAEKRRAVVWRAHRARRSRDHARRHRGRRGLCAVGRVARGGVGVQGRRRLHIALRPDLEVSD